MLAADMTSWQGHASSPRALVCREDARECEGVPDGWADLVVTSPPYANNYDYADATRLEMTFLRDIARRVASAPAGVNVSNAGKRSINARSALDESVSENFSAPPASKNSVTGLKSAWGYS